MPEQNLNPDAVEAATMAVISDELGYIETMSGSEHVARLAVSAYLSALPAQPDTVDSVEELVLTRAGLALANAAFGEGLNAGIRACNEANRQHPFKKPVSPYSAPLLAMIKADRPVEG